MTPSEFCWFDIVRNTLYFKKQFDQRQDPLQLNSIIIDVNRAFILYACSMVNKCITQLPSTMSREKVVQQSIEWARVAAYNTYYLLKESDVHALQVIACL